MRRFNFTGDPADIPLFNAYRKQSDEKISTLENIMTTDAGKKIIQTLRNEKNTYEAIAEKSIEAKNANNTEQVSIYMAQAGTPYKAAMAPTQEGIVLLNEYVKSQEALQNARARQTQLILLGTNILLFQP